MGFVTLVFFVWLLILLGWYFYELRLPERKRRFWNDRRRAGALVIFAVATIVLGIIAARSDAELNWAGVLYHGVQLTALNTDLKHHPAAGLAALCAIMAIGLTVSELVVRNMRDLIDGIRVGRWSDHTVVCGLGNLGRQITEEACAGVPSAKDSSRASKVVVVEIDPDHRDLPDVRRLGARVIIGDATDVDVLRQANVGRARRVFLLTGSDDTNLEGIAGALQLLKEDVAVEDRAARAQAARNRSEESPPRPEIYAHVERAPLTHIVDEWRRDNEDVAVVGAFNVFEKAFESIYETLLVPQRPTNAEAKEVAHYVIVGFDKIGWSLALRLAELCHFENFRRSRLTIVYRSDEAASVRRFKENHPKLFKNMDQTNAVWTRRKTKRTGPTASRWQNGAIRPSATGAWPMPWPAVFLRSMATLMRPT